MGVKAQVENETSVTDSESIHLINAIWISLSTRWPKSCQKEDLSPTAGHVGFSDVPCHVSHFIIAEQGW